MFTRFALSAFILFASTLSIGYAASEDATPTTQLHRTITQHKGWLNTSRPLVADDLKGRIILLDFWTTGCINCIHIIPDLKALEEKYGDKLTVIGVHSAKFKNEGDKENLRQAVIRYGLSHPIINDFDFATWKAFGVRAWPTQILLNPKGLVENIYTGEGNKTTIENDIDGLLTRYVSKVTTAALPLALEKDKQPANPLNFPSKLAYASAEAGLWGGKPVLFVADSGHNRIVVMTMDGTIIDHIGSGKTGRADGIFEQASFHTPTGLAYKTGMLYIADTNNHLLRAANLTSRSVATIAGTGEQGHTHEASELPALQTAISSPWDITFYPDDNHLAIAMAGLHQIWSYDINSKTLSAIAGRGNESIDDGQFPDNALAQTSGLSRSGGKLYFVDAESSSLRVLENGKVTTLIGTGLFDFGYAEGDRATAKLQHPLGIYATEESIYVTDTYNHSIRRYDVATGKLLNFSGQGKRGSEDGAVEKAGFNEPSGIIEVTKKFYVADTNNNSIRVIDKDLHTVLTLVIKETAASGQAK